MAMTHDYLDQLDQNVGIAPANSQEELQAAQTIADLMKPVSYTHLTLPTTARV